MTSFLIGYALISWSLLAWNAFDLLTLPRYRLRFMPTRRRFLYYRFCLRRSWARILRKAAPLWAVLVQSWWKMIDRISPPEGR
jgi:hypothetical protein